MARLTQYDRIIKYMQDFGSISTMQAFQDLGITKLTTRISEMKKMGYIFKTVHEECENRYGDKCHFNRYYLVEKEQLSLFDSDTN